MIIIFANRALIPCSCVQAHAHSHQQGCRVGQGRVEQGRAEWVAAVCCCQSSVVQPRHGRTAHAV